MAYPLLRWLSGTISLTNALKGCIVTLKEVSISNNMVAPNKSGGSSSAKCSEFGMKNMANAETKEPPKIKGILLPMRVQVLSLDIPTMGCTINPARGAANQNKLK